MTTPCSGPISLGDVEIEVPGKPIALGDADVRSFAGIPSGTISLFDLYCLPPPTPADIDIGDAYATSVSPGFGGTYDINCKWDITQSGFSGTPEFVITGYEADLGSFTEEPNFSFEANGNSLSMINANMFADTNLLPTYRIGIRVFVTYYWPQQIGATEQASDVAYLYLEWS